MWIHFHIYVDTLTCTCGHGHMWDGYAYIMQTHMAWICSHVHGHPHGADADIFIWHVDVCLYPLTYILVGCLKGPVAACQAGVGLQGLWLTALSPPACAPPALGL